MTSTESVGTLLLTDEKGRVRTPKERRENALDEFERSGVSGAKFAAIVGTKYSTFAGWVHRRRRERGMGGKSGAPKNSAATVRLLEAIVDKSAVGTAAKLSLILPSGVRIDIADPPQATLAAVFLRAWEKAASAC